MGTSSSAIATPVLALVMSGKAAFFCAAGIYAMMGGVSSISTFSSGALTYWGVTAKSRDYAAMTTFIVVALLLFALLYDLLRDRGARLQDDSLVSLRRSLVLANIPACYALGQLVFGPALPMAFLAYSSIAEIILLLCFASFQASQRRSRRREREETASASVFNWVLPVLLFSGVAGAATPVSWVAFWLVGKPAAIQWGELLRASRTGLAIALAVAGTACVVICAFRPRGRVERGGYLLLAVAQICLLLGLVRLVGPVQFVDGTLQYAASLTPTARGMLVLVAIAAISHVAWRAFRIMRASAAENWMRRGYTVSPLAVALLALLLKIGLFAGVPTHLADEYHSGEFALPYWSYKTFGLLPYVELAPNRGLINLLHGWIAEEILGGTYSSYAFTASYFTLLLFVMLFVCLRWALGPWPALLISCLAPTANGLAEIDVFNTAMLAVICRASWALRPITWLQMWVVLGTGAVLFAPGQGGLLVLATGLLGLTRLRMTLSADAGAVVRTGLILLGVATALVTLTPLGQILFGAIQYGLEQSQANTEANAVPWALSFENAPIRGKAFWEGLRSLWLLVTVGIGTSVYLVLRHSGRSWPLNRHFVIGVPIVLLGLLFVVRAASRIEAGNWSRLGAATAWFILLMLPLYMYFCYRPRVEAWCAVGVVASAGLISPFRPAFQDMRQFGAVPIYAGTAITDGSSIGLAPLGRGPISQEKIDNYLTLKRFVDAEIPQQDTFIDLTNRSSLYYLLRRRPAMEVAAYNLTNERQQARAVRALAAKPPGFVLASSQNVVWDGGSVSLRAHVLYRFVLENYQPFEVEGVIWMKRRQQPLAEEGTGSASLGEAELALLMRVFAQNNLGALPRAWGTARSALSHQMTNLRRISLDGIALHDLAARVDGKLDVIGQQPHFDLYLRDLGITGMNAGILALRMWCSGPASMPSFRVSWTNELIKTKTDAHSVVMQGVSQGHLIIPLDSAPSWVFGGIVSSLRFALVDPTQCKEWRISSVDLGQRAGLARTRAASIRAAEHYHLR